MFSVFLLYPRLAVAIILCAEAPSGVHQLGLGTWNLTSPGAGLQIVLRCSSHLNIYLQAEISGTPAQIMEAPVNSHHILRKQE